MYCQLFCVESSRGHNRYKVTVLLNGVQVTMEIDTGHQKLLLMRKRSIIWPSRRVR